MCQQVDISPTSRPGLARRNTVRTVTQACRFTRFPNTKQYFPDLQKADRRYGSRRTAAWADWPIIKSRSCDIWQIGATCPDRFTCSTRCLETDINICRVCAPVIQKILIACRGLMSPKAKGEGQAALPLCSRLASAVRGQDRPGHVRGLTSARERPTFGLSRF